MPKLIVEFTANVDIEGVELTTQRFSVVEGSGSEFIFDVQGRPDDLSDADYQAALVEMQALAVQRTGFPPPTVRKRASVASQKGR